MSIPKKIHYCWFGGAPLGVEEETCLKSWQQYLPEYEIIRWDESNTDLDCCDYVREAYAHKKWAFVSDYTRFDILYKHGGIYLDTDVELLKPIDDILEKGPFMAAEQNGHHDCDKEEYTESGIKIAPGLGFAVRRGDAICSKMIESYRSSHFERPDGSLNLTTVVDRLTHILFEEGLCQSSAIQEVAGLTIYPADYFNPKNYKTGEIAITDNTRAIHHFAGSWLEPSLQFERKINDWMERRGLGSPMLRKASKAFALLVFFDVKRIKRKLNSRGDF